MITTKYFYEEISNLEAKEYLMASPDHRVRLSSRFTGPGFWVVYKFEDNIFKSCLHSIVGDRDWSFAMHPESWLNDPDAKFMKEPELKFNVEK